MAALSSPPRPLPREDWNHLTLPLPEAAEKSVVPPAAAHRLLRDELGVMTKEEGRGDQGRVAARGEWSGHHRWSRTSAPSGRSTPQELSSSTSSTSILGKIMVRDQNSPPEIIHKLTSFALSFSNGNSTLLKDSILELSISPIFQWVHRDSVLNMASLICAVLDGIGKGLDPRFDITEIAKPYVLELLRFREAGFEVVVKEEGDLKFVGQMYFGWKIPASDRYGC